MKQFEFIPLFFVLIFSFQFFMNSPECTNGGSDIKVCWIMPGSLRGELVRLNLPEQLANFSWFEALFIEADGAVVDFDGNLVDGVAVEDDADVAAQV